MKIEQPILAQYQSCYNYTPLRGDFIIITRFFTNLYGFVVGFDDDVVQITCSTLPTFAIRTDDSRRFAKEIKISSIRTNRTGKYAILRMPILESVWHI